MLYTTFAKAKEVGACTESYRKMAHAVDGIGKYGKNTPIGLDKVIEVCGIENALWTLRCTTESSDKIARIFACDCAEHVLPIFEKQYPEDKRPRDAIRIARLFREGKATEQELSAAESAARSAAWSAAESAAESAARSAAWSAAESAAESAERSAAESAAESAERSAAWSAAESAAWEWQTKRFLELLKED